MKNQNRGIPGSLIILLLIFTITAVNGQEGKPDFTGRWLQDTVKTALPEGGGYQQWGADYFTISQSNFQITRTRIGPEGNSRVFKYNLDGTESVNTSPRGESRSVATWSDDGRKLRIVTTYSIQGTVRTSTEVWTLSTPSTLTIEATRQGPNGEVKSTMVYGKK